MTIFESLFGGSETLESQARRRDREILKRLDKMLKRLGNIMETQAELQAALEAATATLNEVGTGVDNISADVDGLTGEVRKLKEQIDAGGTVSPGVQAAFEALQTRLGTLKTRVAEVDAKVPVTTPPA